MALVNVKLQYRHRGASLNEKGYNCGEKSLSVVGSGDMDGWKFASDSQNKTQLNKQEKYVIFF